MSFSAQVLNEYSKVRENNYVIGLLGCLCLLESHCLFAIELSSSFEWKVWPLGVVNPAHSFTDIKCLSCTQSHAERSCTVGPQEFCVHEVSQTLYVNRTVKN